MLMAISSSQWQPRNIPDNYKKIIPKKTKKTSNSIKSMILLGLISKYSKKNYTKESAFSKWYLKVKAQSMRGQVWKKILTQQRLSQFTFLYRIKAYCCLQNEKTKSQYQTKMKLSNYPNDYIQQQGTKQEKRRQVIEKVNMKNFDQNAGQQEQIGGKIELKEKTNQNQGISRKGIKTHLRSISQQTSNKIISEKELSQIDLIEILDKRLEKIEQKFKCTALRALNILVNKIGYRQRSVSFKILCAFQGEL